MKKCSRYLDAIESNSDQDKSVWQDVIMHASRCPDCSGDMKLRSEMFNIMAELPEPDYPQNLHSLIMHEVKTTGTGNNETHESRWQNLFFDLFLRPFELVLPVACIVMFVFLLRIDEQSVQINSSHYVAESKSGYSITKSGPMVAQIDNDELEKVTAEEVDVFLRQLAEFRKNHPETAEPVMSLRPEGRLVIDRPRRRP